jgi:hypothetical protein
MIDSGRGARRWRHALDDGLKRGWLVLLPFALLPVAGSVPALHQAHASVAVLLGALLAWGYTTVSGASSPRGIALLAKAGEGTWMGPWELCLLAVVMAIAVAYLALGSRVDWLVYEDAAYYYGVARHMALTWRFEEPIVWHFLHPPERLVHAPFDYWGAMTSLLLVPPLALFGATPATALVTMSAISALSLVAFWYLICIALPLRYYATQLLALVIFAFSPAMDLYRFQPESISVAHLFLLLSLIAFCRKRLVLAILGGFCLVLTRPDGLILFALIFFVVLLQARRGVGACPHQVWHLVLVGLACAATYVLWSLASFGTLTPPGPQILPSLGKYAEVYDFGVPHQVSWSEIVDRLEWHFVAGRIRMAFDTLRAIPFAPGLDWWLAIAIVPAGGLLRRPLSPESLIWLLCFGGYFLLACVSGAGFARVRAPYTFTPLVVLAGALGLDAILAQLEAWMEHARSIRLRAVTIGAGVLALCSVLLGRLPVLRGVPMLASLPVAAEIIAQAQPALELTTLDRVLRGEPVASNRPWQIIAYTRSPAVSIPQNGDAAIEAVLARYQVRWMVIFGAPPWWCSGESCTLFNRLLSTERTDLGRFRLERIPVDAMLPAVFRVSAPRRR